MLPTLAVHIQMSGVPVDIIELERRHFASAQSQSGEQEQNGVIAKAYHGLPSDCCICSGGIARGIDGIDQLATTGAAARSNVLSPR